jgi:aryl-alcohol dehydrogenase-like predicted oxidoreductase
MCQDALIGIFNFRLGKSGLKVSKVILGAMGFGNSGGWELPEEQALPIIKHAFESGINTWDTVSLPLPVGAYLRT